MLSEIQNFLEIAKNYDLLLIDVVGVMHDGVNPYLKAIDAINLLPVEQEIIFLSNMPRPGSQTKEKLKKYGINRPFQVVTSGDITRELLVTTYAGKKIYHWGAHRNRDIDAGLTLNLVDNIAQSELVLLTAFMEEGEDESPHDPLIKTIIEKNIPVLCANPDKIAIHGNTIRKCAGSLADKIHAQGGNVILVGKPDPFIYKIILEKYPSLPLQKVLMIGDTIETDIIGAKEVGIGSLLVLTGNTGNELRASNLSLAEYLNMKGWGNITPTYYSNDLS